MGLLFQLRIIDCSCSIQPGVLIKSRPHSAGMNLATPALIFCALFLQEAAASQRASCSGALCCFQHSADFETAEKACEESNGELIRSGSDEQMNVLSRLVRTFTGRFWLRGGTNCTAVSMGSGSGVSFGPEPCRNTLDGFLCMYKSSSVCGAVLSSGGTSVTYRTLTGFDVLESETFPPGTLALVGRSGAQYPDSKHLCMSSWLQSPWSCEVFQGGCDHGCNKTSNTCTCPVARSLHHNNFSCTEPTATRPQVQAKRCPEGYKLAADGGRCEDVDECAETLDLCTGEGEQCVNLDGRYECMCADDFVEEDGACVNTSICILCEHMKCEKVSGVYQCACKEGYRVSLKNPTECEQDCSQRECPAICNNNLALEKKDMQQCYCPQGFILDLWEGSATCYDIDECESQALCDHECENLPGGFRCVCRKGYRLQGTEKCVRLQNGGEEENASGSPPDLASTPVSLQPAPLPSYIKTGSVLGITVFLVLCAALLACVMKQAFRRCASLNLNSIKHPDIDIFYLQQVTTETYKRLSFDKQFKNDS
ncbi:PREDICTED: thrombomodulin-like [Poecilia mexicana]|uniref:Thrombomodulin n=1 Tax=Poecilia mexicana TaxID=48701 RepID=A0A3B3XT78_9TELE|nr:PREDICTED: thrombomodulin-like [Poecilia mexicana]